MPDYNHTGYSVNAYSVERAESVHIPVMKRLLFIAALAASSSVAGAQAVNVTLSEWKVGLSRDTVRAGSVTFRVTNTGSVAHVFYIRGEGVDKGTRDIGPKQAAPLTVVLKAGTYDVFCSMSDESHKLAGMQRKLFVIPADSAEAPKKP
jgi:plastocyanin